MPERVKFIVGSLYQQISQVQPLPTYQSSSGVTLSVNVASTGAIPVNVASTGGLTVSSFMYGTFLNVGTGAGLLQNTAFLTRIGVQVKALDVNTGIIYIAVNSNVTATGSTRGFELSGGQGLLIPIDNLNKLHIVSNVTSQDLAWMAT